MSQADLKAPNRAQGLLSTLGGALIIASYFLPTYVTVNSQATPPYSPTDYMMASNWSSIYPALFGGTSFDSQTNTYVTGQPHIFSILVAIAPMILSALIFILGIWALFKQPGSMRSALFSAAVVVLALSLVNMLSAGISNPYALAGNLEQTGSLLSLGTTVLLLGLFITLVSAFLAWQRK